MTTRAVILAAGKSRRLGPLTGQSPKCLLELGDAAIIDHQIANLRSCGIDDITIVTGFCEDMVRAHCGPGFRYILNPLYDSTNSIYSLWLALNQTAGPVVVMNSDVVFHPAILKSLLASPHPDALTVCFQSGMGDEEMKVQVRGGRITDIRKDMNPADADGENVGVLKFSGDGCRVLKKTVDRLVSSGVVNAWAPRAFKELCPFHPLYAVSTDGLPWIEIDFPEDLEKARGEIYPLIAAAL